MCSSDLGLGLVLAGPLMALAPARAATAVPAVDSPLAPVDVVEVSGLIDRISADSIRTSIARSEKNGAQAVILQVNTRGAVIGRDAMIDLENFEYLDVGRGDKWERVETPERFDYLKEPKSPIRLFPHRGVIQDFIDSIQIGRAHV